MISERKSLYLHVNKQVKNKKMKEENWLSINKEKNKELIALFNKTFSKDIEERMNAFQLLYDELRGMNIANTAHERVLYDVGQMEFVATQAFGTIYHIMALCGFDSIESLKKYVERVKDGIYTKQLPSRNKLLDYQEYTLEYVQNGVIFENNLAKEVNVFEFEESVSKALSVRSVRERLGSLIMSDIEYIVNEDDGNKYKVEVVIKKEDC